MKRICLAFIVSSATLFPFSAAAQHDSLLPAINDIVLLAKGKVSFAVMHIEKKDSWSYHGDRRCTMESVFKFPVALAVLDKMDKGEFSLQHKIHITKEDMTPGTWSPMRDKYPEGNVNITFEELLRYMVSESDNIACDVLLHHLGGPKKVQKYLDKLNMDGIVIKVNEMQMHKGWKYQYKNWCTAPAMNQLLVSFFQGKILSEANTEFLYRLMTETSTGPNRIKGLMPKGTVVAHKTGSSDTNEQGLSPGTNDIGIITLPDGSHLALSVFVNDAYADERTRTFVIAAIAKAVYDDTVRK